MQPELFRNVVILTGPTASGKTALALELAGPLNAEIVAMDSMTLYRGMDIGTAKPTASEQRAVRHHLLDVLDPEESASVAWWLAEASVCVRDIEARGKRPLFVGGTPLYLKTLLYGMFEGPPADIAVRARLEAEEREFGTGRLHARLAESDPPTARRLHPHDLRRIVRALEVQELTGQPISFWQTQWTNSPSENAAALPPCFCMEVPRDELYARIDRRAERMLATGLVEEAAALLATGRPLSREAAGAAGYRESIAYIAGQISYNEALIRIQMRTRQLAKRQITWFRSLRECRTLSAELTFASLASKILESLL